MSWALPIRSGLLACLLSAFGLAGGAKAAMPDAGFQEDMPVVLSVTRLAQPLDETPAAVTVIDRDMIRRSGARELAELLRLVPGFIVSHFDGGARPFATYHADYDAYNRRLQVYIDGRSVYSGLVLGNAAYGMMGVVLDDIERIEVVRGSNSAAYGANAFLGVVNIVTRHAEDTHGGLVNVALGQQGVADATARIGWGDVDKSFRLTVSQRQDDGFRGPDDDKRVLQLHFRGDMRPNNRDELSLSAGLVEFGWGAPWGPSGLGWTVPQRTEIWRNLYAHLRWQRQLDASNELRASVMVDDEVFDDFFPSVIPADGRTRRVNANLQHTTALSGQTRLVWGAEYRFEGIDSGYLFASDPTQSNAVWRLFGNLEWRPAPDWVVNAGGLWEHDGFTGDHTAPRLMVNHHLSQDHTLRAGVTRAFRLPSQLEAKGDWQWPLYGAQLFHMTGSVRPERIDASELGYLGRFRGLGLDVDLRLFEERLDSVIVKTGAIPWDVTNKDPSTQRGWEAQLRWQAGRDTDVRLNHTHLRLDPDATSTSPQDTGRAPKTISSLAVFQRLPADMDLSLMYSRVGSMYFVSQGLVVPAYGQLDLRLAKGFRIGGKAGEAALVVQAANGDHIDFTPSYRLDRRAFLTWRQAL
ncbi:MAG: TonB-dependent receptor [Pseudomonadota bacterium]